MVLNACMMISPFWIARVIYCVSLPIPASWEISLQRWRLVAAFQSVADLHQQFFFVGRPCWRCRRRFFPEPVDLFDQHEDYKRNDDEVEHALQKYPELSVGAPEALAATSDG